MIREVWRIDNSPVARPKNWKDLVIELNYGKDQFPAANTTSITELEWVKENYKYLIKHINDGLTGDVGIMEAPSLGLDLTDNITTKTVFEGYIDLVNELKIKDKIKITAKATSHATVDWLYEVASSISPEYLSSDEYKATGQPGYIDKSLYRFMPYVNNSIPNYEQAAMATLMVFAVSDSIAKALNEIAEITVDMANPFTTANAIIKAIIKVSYLIVLLATLIKLIGDIYKYIISPVKYHAGMYVSDTMQKCSEALGMDFVSDIWAPGSAYEKEFIIPEKIYNAPSTLDSTILGFLFPAPNEQIGYYKGRFSDLLDAMKIKYNAKIVVTAPVGSEKGKIHLLRKDKNAKPPGYQLKGVYTPEYTYNTSELAASTRISFQTDTSDLNTLQDYKGTSFEVVCQPKTVNYRPFALFRNYVPVEIPFSRASTKLSLNVPEKIIGVFLSEFDLIANGLISVVNGLGQIANSVIGIVNGVIDALEFVGIDVNWKIHPIPKMSYVHLSTSITNRIGMMQLSSDHFNKAKIFILKEGSQSKYNKIDPSNNAVETARAAWNNFYYVNSMMPAQLQPLYADRPTGNQYMIKTFVNVPFNWTNFLSVLENNRIFDEDGKEAIVESLKFSPNKGGGCADITVRIQKLWTLNLIETFLEATGS